MTTKTRLALAAYALAGTILVASLATWLLAGNPDAAARVSKQLQALPSQLAGTDSPAPPGVVTVRLEPAAEGRSISPLIYGVAAAPREVVQALGATLLRSGGNPSSRYNWANGHAWNAGRDWEFRNVNYSPGTGSAADANIADALASGAITLQTVPTLGWVARDDSNTTRSRNVPGQGGPPLRSGSDAILGYDPTSNRAATSVPSYARKRAPLVEAPDPNARAVYQDEWINHLARQFGIGDQGVRYFAMDNEPDLWSVTHTDVHPVRTGYDDVLANFLEYSQMVKDQAPQARVLGPEVSGWTGYFYSDLDRGDDAFATHADRRRHGDQPFLGWWLRHVAQADARRGSRTLDLLSVHYYPQAADVYSPGSDPATQARRIRSVRSLYDPGYQDESWIGTSVMLIPRLKQLIEEGYPGTKLAITEYNWGGEKDASGAAALAEVLGVLGREGVELAAYWTYPPPNSPAGAAFRLYRNYDGRGASFGDRSLPVSASDPQVVAFAARHTETGEVDVVLVNESQAGTASVGLALGAGGAYRATEFRVRPGSSDIEVQPMASATAQVELRPLGIALVRLLPA